jgi:ATP-dependent RNA helicase DDX3X
VCSRGIDFPDVSYVFNYDMPTNIDDYIHRIGRTGRCGNKGTSISFVNERNKPILKDLIILLKKLNKKCPQFLYDLNIDSNSNGFGNSSFNSYNKMKNKYK